MRIVIINTDYPEFLSSFYEEKQSITQGYEEQLNARNNSLFGVANYYSKNFRDLGHEAWELHINNEIMQKKWAVENGYKIQPVTNNVYRRSIIKRCASRVRNYISRYAKQTELNWLNTILEAQLKQLKPNVILNQAMETLNGTELYDMCKTARIVIGQIASPLPENTSYHEGYDAVVSSLPNFVEHFKRLGVKSFLNRLAFEPSILEQMPKIERNIDVAFFGSITAKHLDRLALMEKLAQTFDLKIWGNIDKKFLKRNSVLQRTIHPPLWGSEMYRMMQKTKIIVNHHIEIAENYANNMRLYEATGMGCLLITDWKDNLAEIFEPEVEVVTYKTEEECREKIQYYLHNEEARAKIALAGQKRSLETHTYRNRAHELIQLFEEMEKTKHD